MPKRLLSGACAGMTATALTHPLDTMRLRMAMPHHGYKGARGAGGWRDAAQAVWTSTWPGTLPACLLSLLCSPCAPA